MTLIPEWNVREEKLRNAELLVTHYQRLAEMQSDPASTISHAELKRKLAERHSTQADRI